jgi:hypothetical protein
VPIPSGTKNASRCVGLAVAQWRPLRVGAANPILWNDIGIRVLAAEQPDRLPPSLHDQHHSEALRNRGNSRTSIVSPNHAARFRRELPVIKRNQYIQAPFRVAFSFRQ